VSGIASTFRKHWLEIAWGVFALANLGVIVALDQFETVPFHFIWVSLTLLYGLRVWRARTTGIVLFLVMASTGAALTWTVIRGDERIDEITEVPLMAAMFVAMVWHAHRRQRAIEEAKRAAATERRVLDRQRMFVQDASHELRTPITVARGHVELLRSGVRGAESASDLDVIIDELDRLSRLTDRLLTLAGADHPAFLVLGPIDVPDLIDGTIRRWEAAASRDWHAHAVAAGTVFGDRERIEVAIDALIENAVHATHDGDRISVRSRVDEQSLVLEVSDGGPGIAAEDVAHLFERFSRRERDRARRSGGTGLGLAIVKAIAEAHGGTADAQSEAGRGATFRIRLPRYRDRAGESVHQAQLS
jgi:two-component system OmpR family sensor kinase